MKTITCAQFGGPCDFAMTAATEEEMKAMCWKHAAEAHPDKMEEVKEAAKNATPGREDTPAVYFHKVWEAAPEDVA